MAGGGDGGRQEGGRGTKGGGGEGGRGVRGGGGEGVGGGRGDVNGGGDIESVECLCRVYRFMFSLRQINSKLF